MDKKKLAAVLRLGFGALLILYAAGLGFSHRTPWIILPLTLAFSVLYIAGKWPALRHVWQDGGVGRALPPVLAIQAIQAMLAGILYLTGLGLGRLISPQPMTQTVSASDLTGLALVVLLGLGVSVAIGRLEAAPDPEHLRETPQPGTAAELTILPGPVTAANMFGPYQGADDFARAAFTRQNDKKPVRQPKAANDLALDAAEARLGFALPDGLRAIYKFKNGGSAPDLVVPKRPQPRPLNEDWADAFGGYEELYSLERLRTVHDSVLDYAYEDEADAFPEGARQMLVLAQWYRETTLWTIATATGRALALSISTATGGTKKGFGLTISQRFCLRSGMPNGMSCEQGRRAIWPHMVLRSITRMHSGCMARASIWHRQRITASMTNYGSTPRHG